jgi:hypothetical protein
MIIDKFTEVLTLKNKSDGGKLLLLLTIPSKSDNCASDSGETPFKSAHGSPQHWQLLDSSS